MQETLSDEELMLRVREGVSEMLGILFDRHHAKLFNFYVRLTGNRALSEDLVQDVFYRILRSRRTYRPGSPFTPWMFQVARNARRDNLRRRVEVEFTEDMGAPILPVDELSDREQTQLLHRALMQLTEEKREVLLLSRFQDLKYSEIAQLLGCEVGTVKARVFRALRELRQILTAWEARSRPHSNTRDAYEM